MRLIELFSREATAINVVAPNKEAVIDKLIDLQFTHGNITDKAVYKKAIYAREEEFSTYVGNGIVVPHAKTPVVTKPSLALVRLKDRIQYNPDDDEKSDLFFMIAAPMNGDLHVDILARMMTMLADEDFVAKLRLTKNEGEILDLLDHEEEMRFGDESFTQQTVVDDYYRILCVTACPTGIAHTYMAAENLQKAGAKLGLATKVETNGSGGAKNVLTAEEIAKADGIVIAADKNVEMARFDGKPVVMTRVADGIHKPEELIQKIINKEAPIYHHKGGAPAADSGASAGSAVYKHLMNGISNMLPFVVGGGIMIALAFLLDDYSIDPSNFGMNTPLAAFFKSVGGEAFGFMLPVLAGFIAMSIADRPGLAVGFTGGALAASGLSFSSIFSGANAVPSGFLGALLAGFVAGYLVRFLENVTENLPRSLNGIRPMLIYPFGGILTIGIVMCAINPFMGMINNGIAALLNSMGGTSAVLLGAVVGGMMSVDMGGPVNKAAYAFGIMSLSSGNYGVMAAVMVGGMVPPIVIALSTTLLARNKWSEEERNNGIVNYIMGLCFISEGAIPYAAGDPLRVLPSCIVGSAVAGALSMAFGCTLMAPHGGIFVFPTVGNPVMYIVALLVGSFVGAAILSALKPARKD